MNFTRADLEDMVGSEMIKDAQSLLLTGEMVLTFSYWSGFFIASFNFVIFLLACVLYGKVRG